MEIIVGTNNPNKIQEMQQSLAVPNIRLIPYHQVQEIAEKPDETGDSYVENALIKAQFYHDKLNKPVLADDGGLVFEAFPDRLGVHTSRFFHSQDTAEQNKELLDMFTETDLSRKLTLSATLVYYFDEQHQFITRASLEGLLVSPKGHGGYGFDSVILIPEINKTLAELTDAERSLLSPRARALNEMVKKILEVKDV